MSSHPSPDSAAGSKNGLLTATDDRGRILAEQPTHPDGTFSTLLVSVPVRHDDTLYQSSGDWFAWVDLAAVAAVVASLWIATDKRKATPAALVDEE